MSSQATLPRPVILPASALEFMRVVGRLKTTKRTGWVHRGVSLPESIADHMYRMAILGMLIVDPRVHTDKLVKMCIVHDLAESVVGDIAPFQGVAKEDKRRWEEDGLRRITEALNCPAVADEIVSLWLEYEEGGSVEGEVARQLDRFEMVVQADEYERAQGMRLDDFFNSTEGYFTHAEVGAWDRTIREQRRARLEQQEQEQQQDSSSS